MTNFDSPSGESLEEITAIACTVAWGASDILRSYYRGEGGKEDLQVQETKKGPVTAADLATNQYILEQLQAHFAPEIFGYLSEETHQGTDPIPQAWVWIIDPLDGTRDFIDKTGEYAIHIALAYRGRPVVAVVAVPEAEKVYFASKDKGTFVETRDGQIQSIRTSNSKQIADLSLVVSRTHRDDRFQQLIDRLPLKSHHYVGSIGCKIATILERKSDVYISLSGKSAPKDWDFAAPELILTEAGGKFTHFNGDLLIYNQGDVHQWGGLLASNGSYHESLCQEAAAILAVIDQSKGEAFG